MFNPYVKKSGQFYVQNYADRPQMNAEVMVSILNGPSNRAVANEFLHKKIFYIPVNQVSKWDENDVSKSLFKWIFYQCLFKNNYLETSRQANYNQTL